MLIKAIVDMQTDFNRYKNVYGLISTWNTRFISDMSELFKSISEFNEDISKWNVSRVTNMSNMFNMQKSLIKI